MKNVIKVTYYKINICILHIPTCIYFFMYNFGNQFLHIQLLKLSFVFLIHNINYLSIKNLMIFTWLCYFIFSKKWSSTKHIYKLSNERRKFRGIGKDPTDKIRWTLLDGLKGKASRMKSRAWSWTTGKWLYRFDSIVSRVCVRVWKTKNSKKRGISFTKRTFMTMKREI